MPAATPDPSSGPMSSRYLETRAAREDAAVRAAFADLDARLDDVVVQQPASRVLNRSRRGRATRRGWGIPLVVAAAAAVGGVVVLTGVLPVAGTGTPADGPTASGTAVPTPSASVAVPTPTPTVTVTVTAQAQAPVAPAPTPKATRKKGPTPQATVRGTTEITVYLWQGTLFPTCANQYAVTRFVQGPPTFETVMRSVLEGVSAEEDAQGWSSPFGAGTRYTLDAEKRVVDFGSKAVIDDALTACRPSVEALLTRTAAANGLATTVTMQGSATTWAQWKAGQF